eukprot:3870233-Prorocentrum_lima.AAC.1
MYFTSGHPHKQRLAPSTPAAPTSALLSPMCSSTTSTTTTNFTSGQLHALSLRTLLPAASAPGVSG